MEGVIGSVLGMALGLALGLLATRVSSTASRLERKLDLLIRHSGIDVPAVAVAEAAALAKAGNKIEAIKAYRELTGCGLAEAKTKVESLG